jgi:hypothetical protein
MEDHRRNAWYLLGATPLTAGCALAVGWLIAVDSHVIQGRPSYWGVPSYVAMGLIVVGGLIIGLIMTETWPFRFRRAQHEVAEIDLSGIVATYDGDIVPRSLASSQGSQRRAKNLSEVSKNPEFANDPISGGSEIPVDLSALQPRPLGARANIPDFSSEIRRFQEIDRIYDGSDEANQDVDNWIQDVNLKLEAWIPRNAQRFMAGGAITTSIAQAITAPLTGRFDLADNPKLALLHQQRHLLRDIVNQ